MADKLISVDELKRRMTGNFREVHVEQLMAILDEMPENVVRCERCKYNPYHPVPYFSSDDAYTKFCIIRDEMGPDGFCSFGEAID